MHENPPQGNTVRSAATVSPDQSPVGRNVEDGKHIKGAASFPYLESWATTSRKLALQALTFISGSILTTRVLLFLSISLILLLISHGVSIMWSDKRWNLLLAFASVSGTSLAAAEVSLDWHAPSRSQINDLNQVVEGSGIYGFIFNSSTTPDEQYGVYNWCNMPHARAPEYKKPSDAFELQYVELIHRHHKRTPYSSNAFPIEPYRWNCDDQGLYFYGQPFNSPHKSATSYWAGFISDVNPYVPSGWIGTCQFPQITAPGLDDSWQHGADLYALYHDRLNFLPGRDEDWRSKVAYRVTTNLITSQVAGMVIDGMWGSTTDVPLRVQSSDVDSLEPKYSCPRGNDLFNNIKSNNDATWSEHLTVARPLYATLDDISGVPPSDGGFHASFDHYFDNLSARQCHNKPLPCKLVDGANSTTCVTQELAESVYRFGQWEYSYIYRDAPNSLPASAASFGVWISELATHLRAVIDGTSNIIYFHNIAHDGSVSRLLSILQLDVMVWPGMGSEVVFELYKKRTGGSQTSATSSGTASGTTSGSATATDATRTLSTETSTGDCLAIPTSCQSNKCLRQMVRNAESATAFCSTFTETADSMLPTWLAGCNGSAEKALSACSCLQTQSSTSSTASMSASESTSTSSSSDTTVSGSSTTSAPASEPTGPVSESGHYIRVLWGGQVLKSSNPSLGEIDMIPVEILLEYFDGLAGKGASLVKQKCQN